MLSRGLRTSSILRRTVNQSGLKAVVFSQLPRTLSANSSYNKQLMHFSTEKVVEEPPKTDAKKDSAVVVQYDYDDYDDYEEPKNAAGWVKMYTVLFLRLSMLALGAGCIYLTAGELFPGRMNPNTLFSEAFEKLLHHEEVMVMTGPHMKAFGRDVGRNTEGRRNHVDSYKYTGDDGSKRTRVRFNIKGDKGKVIVWAEISDRMASNEYVYIICQNARTGRVVTVEDNRDRLDMELHNNAAEDVSGSLINKFLSGKKDA